MDRNETIKAIRKALRERSGKSWSVRGGRGSVYGWIYIDTPPSRAVDGHISQAERAELAALLGLDSVDSQGVSVPSSSAYYQEYVDRAAGRQPSRYGTPYWD